MDTPILRLVGRGRDGPPAMIAGNVEALAHKRAASKTPSPPAPP
jgi:hypothetical protein